MPSENELANEEAIREIRIDYLVQEDSNGRQYTAIAIVRGPASVTGYHIGNQGDAFENFIKMYSGRNTRYIRKDLVISILDDYSE